MPSLTIALAIKLIAEIALMALLGQGLLALLAGRKRDTNLFYNLLTVLTRPFVRATRLVTPRFVVDQHVPYVTFFLLACIWLGATFMKIVICARIGVEQCL